MGAGAERDTRAEVAGDTRPETYAAIDRLAEKLGRWDVAGEAARKWVALAPEEAGALAAGARVRRHNGEFEAALELFLDAAARETTGSTQAALLTEAGLIVQGGVGKETREEDHGRAGRRALRARAGRHPITRRRRNAWPRSMRRAGAGPTSRSCWTSSSTGSSRARTIG